MQSDHSKQSALSDFAQTKRQAKISDTQSVRWQRLAKVPEEKFERQLGDANKKVSTTGLIEDEKPVKPVPSRALWF